MRKSPTESKHRLLWVIVVFLASIGVAAGVRRTIVLFNPSQAVERSDAKGLDAPFARHRALTLIHIVPGMLFMILAPLQFIPRIRRQHRKFHRWAGRVVVGAGIIIGVTALVMSFGTVIGGANETAATVTFALIFLFELVVAFIYIRRGNVARHREWMIRAYAIALAIATIRPIIGAFFAARRLSPHEFFGIAFWIGFTVHLIAAEVWLSHTRPGRPPEMHRLQTRFADQISSSN